MVEPVESDSTDSTVPRSGLSWNRGLGRYGSEIWGSQLPIESGNDPDVPKRFASNAPLNTPDQQTFYADGPQGYTDCPALPDSKTRAGSNSG
jgi:hypothetical protein